MVDELHKRHTGCGWKKALPHLLFLVALIGILFHISSKSSRPDLIVASMRASFGKGQYVISGKVVTGDRTPVVGATVSLCAELDDLWKGKKQIGSTSTDESGSYKIVLDSMPKGVLLVSKPGYEELISSSSFSDCCSFRRDFILKETTATVKGRVEDEAGNPVSGALVYASLGNMQRSTNYSIYPSLVAAKTDSQGRYEVHVTPDVNRWLVAGHEEFKESSKRLSIKDRLEYTVDFNLRRGNFKFMKVRIVDTEGAPIPSARLADNVLRVMGMSSPDKDGICKLRFNMDKIKKPLQCTVSAQGYFSRWLVVDLNQPQLNIVLEREPAITGTVRSHAGQPLANVKVDFRDAGNAKTVRTNRLGFFSVPVTNPSAKYLQFSKSGYKVLDLKPDSGTMHDPLQITLESDQKERQEVRGFYGKVLDSSGRPAFAFDIQLFPVNPEKTLPPSRPFLSLDGEFSINDLPAGSYRLCPQRQSADRNAYLCPVPHVIEIRKGSMVGPIVLQLQEPEIK